MDDDWMARGACRSLPHTTMFPHDGLGVTRAKQVCAGCASRAPCLQFALDRRISHGIWGGASERERRRLLKARAA
jgi:WhiB family redox-sensing transcriptional regulator